MSNKHLRRVVQQELVSANSDEDFEEEVPQPVQRQKKNKFATLDEEREDPVEVPKSSQPTSSKTKKNKKVSGKQKKNEAGCKSKKEDDFDWAEAEAMRAAEAAAEAEKKNASAKALGDVPKWEQLLTVTSNELNADIELKQILGREYGAGAANHHRGNKDRKSKYRIVPNSTAMTIDTAKCGLTVVPDNNPIETKPYVEDNDAKYYRYVHDQSYQEAQQLFWTLAETGQSPTQTILENHPYHLDTFLLHIEELLMADHSGDARKVLDFAIRIVEDVFPPAFELISPNTRLSYAWRENRAFFLLLFKHVQMLINRRCFATAFYVAKFLFSKNLDDPLSVLSVIDSLALRCGRYSEIVDFYATFRERCYLNMLPNMGYSLAIAYHGLALEENDENYALKAKEQLRSALTTTPFILMEACAALQIVPSPAVKKAIFRDSDMSPMMDLLVKIYLHHNLEDVWKRVHLVWIQETTEQLVAESGAAISKAVDQSVTAQKMLPMIAGIMRHGVLCGVRACDQGIPAVDPYPPVHNNCEGYIRRFDFALQIDADTPNEGGANNGGVFDNVLRRTAELLLRTINPEFQAQAHQRLHDGGDGNGNGEGEGGNEIEDEDDDGRDPPLPDELD